MNIEMPKQNDIPCLSAGAEVNNNEDRVKEYTGGYFYMALEQDELYVDMHTHSTASDGSMTPAELVRHASEAGIAAIALTDHDTVDGVEQALDEGMRIGVEIIPGVEISVDFEPEMHLLGYFSSGNYRLIMKTLGELRQKREQRNPKIISKLNELGFDITLSEVKQFAPGGNIGRLHIARVMIEKGYAGSIEEVFDKYLAAGKPAYFKKEKLSPDEGIAEIAKAGGVPVLAHPIYLGMPEDSLDRLLAGLAQAGLKGIEAYYSDNTAEQTEGLLRLAAKHRLLVTGGSDFHGRHKPDIRLGSGRGNLRVPYSLLAAIKQAGISFN